MKILMLGWELPPHNSGGLGVACYYMAKALASRGVSIDFVVPYNAEVHNDINFMSVLGASEVTPQDLPTGCGAYDTDFMVKLRSLGYDVDGIDNTIRALQRRYIKYIERLVLTEDADVIHAHDWLTMEAGVRAKELTGKPLIVHVHATEYDRAGNENSGNPVIHEIEYHGLMMADRILAVSQNTKNIIVEKYGIPANKIEVVYNAIDVDSLNDSYVYDEGTYQYLTALQQDGYTVVSTITRFTAQKGLAFLVRAAAKALQVNSKIAFLLVGDGEQRNELIRLASDLGIADKVFFTGFVRGKRWRDAYSLSDVFVMSSVSEPFGLTALEAAHHNNALILTNQSGVSELLNNILRYDYWDENMLANQIVRVSTDASLKQELQNGVKNEYTRLSWYDIADKCIGCYKREIQK